MRLSRLLLLSLVCLSAFLVGMNSCSTNGPKVTVYISNPVAGGMDFSDAAGTKGFVEYPKTDKFVCLTPIDTQTLLNYCGIQTSEFDSN